MGWFWGSSGNAGNTDAQKDEVKSFNEETTATPDKFSTPATLPPDASTQTSSEQSEKPKVPSQSLYPDGRYAHLWKTYQPLDKSEAEGGMSNAERVIDQFKRRKETLNDAALENCAEEHEALTFCFKNGGIGSRMTLCRAENQAFARCYTMQAKFLQALGYASSFKVDRDREERIQMHADKLFHQMLDYEKRVEEAQKAGEPVPPPTSLFNPNAPTASLQPTEGQSEETYDIPGGETLPTGVKFSKPPAKLTPHERELEVRVARQQADQRLIYKGEVSDLLVEEEEAKKQRQQKMTRWFGETVGKWLS